MHDDVIKWKHFLRCWPFVRGIHRWPVKSPHKGQWRGALMFSSICAWTNGWENNRDAGDLRRYRAYYDVTVMDYFTISKGYAVTWITWSRWPLMPQSTQADGGQIDTTTLSTVNHTITTMMVLRSDTTRYISIQTGKPFASRIVLKLDVCHSAFKYTGSWNTIRQRPTHLTKSTP